MKYHKCEKSIEIVFASLNAIIREVDISRYYLVRKNKKPPKLRLFEIHLGLFDAIY